MKNKEYILFELTKHNDRETYKTQIVYNNDIEFILYNQFAKDRHNSKIEEMDLIPYIIEDRDYKYAMVVTILYDNIKKNLNNTKLEMLELLQEYI